MGIQISRKPAFLTNLRYCVIVPQMKETYLYLIDCQQKYLKVGVADDPAYRLDTFQTGNPHDLNMVGLVSCKSRKSAYAAESECHRKCSKFRKKGEWFNYTRFEKQIKDTVPHKDYIFSLLLKIITIRGDQSQRLTVLQWPKHGIAETQKIRDDETNLITGEQVDILVNNPIQTARNVNNI